MADWTTASSDLRDLLADNATDKLKYRKRLIGRVDGTNTVFKTFEKRRLTDFTSATAPEGAYIDGVLTAAVADDLEVGEFTFASAPNSGQLVEGTYYVQWFLDSDLDSFMQSAADWLGSGTIEKVDPGLRPAAKYYAAQEAYHSLALYWANRISDTYRLEDKPPDGFKEPVDVYRALAEDARKKAIQLRDDFYKGQGEANKPLSTSLAGAVRQVVPRR